MSTAETKSEVGGIGRRALGRSARVLLQACRAGLVLIGGALSCNPLLGIEPASLECGGPPCAAEMQVGAGTGPDAGAMIELGGAGGEVAAAAGDGVPAPAPPISAPMSMNADSPGAIVDAGAAPGPGCVLGPFQEPELLTGLEQGLSPDPQPNLWSPSLSPDGRTLFFGFSVDGDEQIANATRQDRGPDFSAAAPLSALNTAGQDGTPLLSADGLSLYFFSTREGGLGNRDVWFSMRPDVGADFTPPALVAGVNGPADDHLPWLSADQLTMLWTTNRDGGAGGFDIWIARRAFRSDGFSNIVQLNAVNSASTEGRAVLGDGELTMYFPSDRAGTMGSLDLWVATRSNEDDGFSQITNLASVNSSGSDSDPFLSADERELMFASDRDGRMRLWRSVRVCE